MLEIQSMGFQGSELYMHVGIVKAADNNILKFNQNFKDNERTEIMKETD